MRAKRIKPEIFASGSPWFSVKFSVLFFFALFEPFRGYYLEH
jgi:hypothetical protein